MSNFPLLEFRDLTLSAARKRILNQVSGSVAKGTITALIGPNGSGKSSLLTTLAGLQQASSGEISLKAKPLADYSRLELAKQLAFLPQRNPVPASLTVADLVAYGRHPHRPWYRQLSAQDKDCIDWAMAQTQVSQYAQQALTALSGGELQRAWLAMVLAQDTPLLMLDEPTSWLDITHQLTLLKIVQRLHQDYGKTIIWVLHDLNQALQYSEQAMLLYQGEIVSQGAAEQVINAVDISEVYQTELGKYQVGGQPLLLPTALT